MSLDGYVEWYTRVTVIINWTVSSINYLPLRNSFDKFPSKLEYCTEAHIASVIDKSLNVTVLYMEKV